jgi:hypothetical protein
VNHWQSRTRLSLQGHCPSTASEKKAPERCFGGGSHLCPCPARVQGTSCTGYSSGLWAPNGLSPGFLAPRVRGRNGGHQVYKLLTCTQGPWYNSSPPLTSSPAGVCIPSCDGDQACAGQAASSLHSHIHKQEEEGAGMADTHCHCTASLIFMC